MIMAIMKNGTPMIFQGNYIHDVNNKKIYCNPTKQQLRLCGYKEYINTKCTLEEKDGFYIACRFEVTDDTITNVWYYEEIEEINEVPGEEVIDDELS